MKKQSVFSHRTIGFYGSLIASVIALVSLALYAMFAHASGTMNVMIVIALLMVIIAQIMLLKFDSDWLIVAMPILSMIALCAFVVDNIYTFVGHFMNLNMFGDQSLYGQVQLTTIALAITTVLLLVVSFMKRRSNTHSSAQ